MKNLLKLFTVFVLCLFFSCSYVLADELIETKDYVFTSYNLMDSYEINQIAKKIKEQKYDSAEKSLKNVPQADIGRAEYYLCKGEIELHKNNIDLAGVYFTKALEKVLNRYYGFHNQPIVYNEFAKMHYIKGNYEKALEYSDKAMSYDNLEKEIVVTRIKILENLKSESPKIIVKYDSFVNDMPEIKDYKDNVETWKEILNILILYDAFKDNSEYSWGEIFSITKNQKERKTNRDKLLKTIPLVCLAKTELVYSLGYKKQAKNLVYDLINVASTSGDSNLHAKSYWVKAMILSEGFENYKDGITAMTNALQLDPSNPLYYLQRSWMYIKNKQDDFALADVDKCIELYPTSSVAYEYKANYLEYMGKREEALKNYKKALEINPNSKNAKDNIARIQGRIKAIEKEKNSGVDAYTSTRLSVSENFIQMMKGSGLLKRIQKGSNKTINFYVDEKIWYSYSGEGYINTLTIVEEYAYLRGYEIIDFKSNTSGKLLYRHRIKFIEIP